MIRSWSTRMERSKLAEAYRRAGHSALRGFVVAVVLCGCSTTDAPLRDDSAPSVAASVAPSAVPVRAFALPIRPARALARRATAAPKPRPNLAPPGVPPDFFRILMIREAQRIKEADNPDE